MRILPLLVLLAAAPVWAQNSVEPGFEPIFDGETLNGWDGDPTYWSVEDGSLVGRVTPETVLDRNTFIIWRGGGELADFELRLEYRITDSGNSGINYRSIEVPGLPYALRGYQADLHGGDSYTGNIYEERGRTFLALRGQKAVAEGGVAARVVERYSSADDLQATIRKEADWNDARIVVRGSHIQQYFNGRLFAELIDEHAGARQLTGLIGVQVHVGPPMTVEFRNIRLKRFESDAVATIPFEDLPERQRNRDVLPLLETQSAELMAPTPETPSRAEITLRARPRYLRSTQTDLVLDFNGEPLKIPGVPAALAHLSPLAEYDFELSWGDGVYRVTRVQSGGRALYVAP